MYFLLGKEFFERTQKHKTEKLDKWDFIKINLCSLKDAVKKMSPNHRLGEENVKHISNKRCVLRITKLRT